jgi:hypothetical protein
MLTQVLPIPTLLVSGILLLSALQLFIIVGTCASLRAHTRERKRLNKLLELLSSSSGEDISYSLPEVLNRLKTSLPSAVAKEVEAVITVTQKELFAQFLDSNRGSNSPKISPAMAHQITTLRVALSDAVEAIIMASVSSSSSSSASAGSREELKDKKRSSTT